MFFLVGDILFFANAYIDKIFRVNYMLLLNRRDRLFRIIRNAEYKTKIGYNLIYEGKAILFSRAIALALRTLKSDSCFACAFFDGGAFAVVFKYRFG
ncbi:MAG: hypothetical protein LBO72_01920, partial [Helicobacteraceae bacterium]|nr:hypothetical protein [Helicobacteraceae bacterium]